jgi:predicted phosphoadenosine phosphosulfate sulfurtransferase
MYDWKTEDIRTAVWKLWLKRNKIYDKMYLRGKSIHDMRICQPYWDDQRKGLDLFQECEPETRDRVLKRVSWVNYWAIYRGQRVLGNYKVKLPKGHTYKSYTIYLLSTLPKPIRIHYLRRVAVFLNRWRTKEWYTDIPDFVDEKLEWKKYEPSRRRICKAILKNDYYCKSLSFTMNTYEFEKLVEIEKKCLIKEKLEEQENWEFLYTIKIQKNNNVLKGIVLRSKNKPSEEGDYLVYKILL